MNTTVEWDDSAVSADGSICIRQGSLTDGTTNTKSNICTG